MGALCHLISLTPRIHHSQSWDLHPTDSTMRWFVRKAVFAVSGWTEFHLRGQTEGDAATLEMGHFCEWRCVTTRECVCLDVFFFFFFLTFWLLPEEWLVAKRRNICKWTPSDCIWVCESGLAVVKAKAPLWTRACLVPAVQHGKCLVLRRAASTFRRGGKTVKGFY